MAETDISELKKEISELKNEVHRMLLFFNNDEKSGYKGIFYICVKNEKDITYLKDKWSTSNRNYIAISVAAGFVFNIIWSAAKYYFFEKH